MSEWREQITCERCTKRGPYIGHLDPVAGMDAAEQAGFRYVMVMSGPHPWYRWECQECWDWDKRMGKGEQ